MKQRCGNCVFYEPPWYELDRPEMCDYSISDNGHCDWYTLINLPTPWKKLTRIVETTSQSGRSCKCFIAKVKK